jgi:hypothetical protein
MCELIKQLLTHPKELTRKYVQNTFANKSTVHVAIAATVGVFESRTSGCELAFIQRVLRPASCGKAVHGVPRY